MSPPPRLAALCRYLRRTIDPARLENERVVALCSHIVREGSDCVGPFLEGAATDCGLWEPRPEDDSSPHPWEEGVLPWGRNS